MIVHVCRYGKTSGPNTLRLYGPRLYDGELGRFLQPDTIIPNLYEPQSHNPYSYCHNDPVNYVDPGGHYRRVPRIFPHGESPDHQGLRIALLCSNVAEYFASLVCGYNNLYAVILMGNIALKSIAPTVLARDGDTLTRGQAIARIGVDFLANMVAAGIGQAIGREWLKGPLSGVEEYLARRLEISGELVRHGTNLLRTVALTGLAHHFSGQAGDWIDSFNYGLDIGINFRNERGRTARQACEDGHWEWQEDAGGMEAEVFVVPSNDREVVQTVSSSGEHWV